MKILLVVYDNDSYTHWFPQGVAYIAAILRRMECEVEIYNQDFMHYPDEHLTQYLNTHKFDIIGFSFIAGYFQYRKALSISKAINRSKNRPFYIIGGHGPSPEPEYFIKKTNADIVVIGEGEQTIVEVVNALAAKSGFEKIKGVAYKKNKSVVINERRPLIDDIDSIPKPAYELFPIEYYRLLRVPHSTNRDFVMPLLSGRGCIFTCNFCYRMDPGFRPRSGEAIVEEIKFLQKNYGITYIAFSDELLMSSVKRTEEICNLFISKGLDIKWNCNGRLNFAEPHILKLMKKAGCVFINYGIEAFDDQILRNMNKALTTNQIVKGIEATLAEGISPGCNIIFGNIGENKKTLQQGVDFLLKYSDGTQMRTIRPVTPYPGTPLYNYAIKIGLLKGVADFYENRHVNSDLVAVNFTDLTDDEFHDALYQANTTLIDHYFRQKNTFFHQQTQNLYVNKNVKFRGFRHS